MPVNEWDVLCLRMLFLYEMAKGGQQSQHEKYNHKLYILVFIVFFFFHCPKSIICSVFCFLSFLLLSMTALRMRKQTQSSYKTVLFYLSKFVHI